MSPRLAKLGAVLLTAAGLPGIGLPAAHAGTGCTITNLSPVKTCMYACVAGEHQTVAVTGNDVAGTADCGFAAASCYSAPLSTGCTDRSSDGSTFTDVYWRACSASAGSLATVWSVTCTSA